MASEVDSFNDPYSWCDYAALPNRPAGLRSPVNTSTWRAPVEEFFSILLVVGESWYRRTAIPASYLPLSGAHARSLAAESGWSDRVPRLARRCGKDERRIS